MWAMMEKLRMFFINKLKTKKSGTRPAGGPKAVPAQYKKSAALGRTALGPASQASALSCDCGLNDGGGNRYKPIILPDFGLESPVSALNPCQRHDGACAKTRRTPCPSPDACTDTWPGRPLRARPWRCRLRRSGAC